MTDTDDSASQSHAPSDLLPHQMDDKVFRATLQQKDAVTLLLTEFVPPSLHQHIDLDALELDNTEWETRDFHSFFEDIPQEFLKYLPNFKFLLANVQLAANSKILKLPEENVLRALFLMFKCDGDEAQIKQYFGEIFKFYKNQPHLQEIMQLYLIYLMASANISMEEIITLMESISPKSKQEIMTTYEVLVSKGKILGREEGRKLQLLQTIWDAHVLKMPISNIAALFKMAPSMVNKWLKRFEWMREGEAEGLTPTEIMLKVNEFAAEPAVTELEVTALLAFFKEQPAPKTKKRRTKKEN
jgi:hypothetical protein